jgi:protein-disulfide isomerase
MHSVAQRHHHPSRRIYVGSVAAASLVVAALVIGSIFGKSGTEAARPATAQLAGMAENEALFAGIPQHGNVLGSPGAPVTLVEYADLQCPYCGEFARNALPTLVAEYVRAGKVKLIFRGLAFVGPESETALRAVLAAAAQNRLWNVAHLVYQNQGAENSGWVTDGFVRLVAGSVAGTDVTRLVAQARSAKVTNQIAALQTLATHDGISSTPSFTVGRTGGTLTVLRVTSLDPAAFRPSLDRLLRE